MGWLDGGSLYKSGLEFRDPQPLFPETGIKAVRPRTWLFPGFVRQDHCESQAGLEFTTILLLSFLSGLCGLWLRSHSGFGDAPRRVAGPPRMRGQSPSRKQSSERKWELPGTGGCGRRCSGVRSVAAGGGRKGWVGSLCAVALMKIARTASAPGSWFLRDSFLP